jgi:isopenicillin-N N-acyltransferase-like protein
MARSLPLVDLEGDARERGRVHGRKARARIARNVDLYRQRFAYWTKASPEELRKRAEAYRDVIARSSPEYLAAMEGIAEGAGLDLIDIVAVNVRYEILYSGFSARGIELKRSGLGAAGGCTSFAIAPSHSANGHLLLGQNWDWLPEVEGLLVRTALPDGTYQLAFTEAGIAGAKIGLNSHGIGLAVNGLVSNEDGWSRLRKPFHVRCWEILAARDFDAAVSAVSDEPRSCSANFLLAQAGAPPRIADLETAPESECRIEATDGFVTHTNHFLDQDKLGVWQPLAEDRKSTFHRYERSQSLLKSLVGRGRKVSIADLKDMLSDHEGAPDCICRHGDPSKPPEEQFSTVVSAILDLDAKEMYVASGPPCTARYRRVRFEDRIV